MILFSIIIVFQFIFSLILNELSVFFSDFSKHLLLTKTKVHIMLKEGSNYLAVVVLSLPMQ